MRKNRVDVALPTIDELLELFVANGVASTRGHGDAEGLGEESAVDLWLHGSNVERHRLLRSEVPGHRTPRGGHIDIATRNGRDDGRGGTVRPVIAVDAVADDIADDAAAAQRMRRRCIRPVVADQLHTDLTKLGIDVLVDDRDQRPGVKFKDADLIGIPLRIVLGDKSLANNEVELKLRTEKDPKMLPLAGLAEAIAGMVKDAIK